jgi:two-component system, chemotaxis family, protein-glutamate methylesterase/glutaminase
MAKIRILVVEDSVTVRKRLVEVLASDPELSVVGEAADGKEAIELCGALLPDVVTLDMMLPVMSGLAATEYIMAHFPTPILVVSASTNRGELFKTYEALAAGAVDVLEKPSGTDPDGAWEARLLSTIKLVARIKVITHPRARIASLMRESRAPEVQATPILLGGSYRAIALGASTGGPGAVVEIVRSLPASFPLPILLVLHIGEPFGTAFAEWLDGQTSLRVAQARDGDALASLSGRVTMAPPDRHLVVSRGRLRLGSGPERHSCRPSVDVLFESLASEMGRETAACLLTGMGRDGASGLLKIRQAGGFTIAQDEATSVVYGMPREAVAMGAADRVLPLHQIAPALTAIASGRADGARP